MKLYLNLPVILAPTLQLLFTSIDSVDDVFFGLLSDTNFNDTLCGDNREKDKI